MKAIFKYLSSYTSLIVFSMSVKFIGTITELFIPYILQHIIDVIIPMKSIEKILFWGILMLVCALLTFVLNVIANRGASKVANSVIYNVRRDLYGHIFNMSCSEVDHFTVPSLISRISSDTYNVRNMIGMLLRVGIRAPILIIGGIIMTLVLDAVLASILIATVPFIALIIVFLSRYGIPLYSSVQNAVDTLVLKVREFFSGIRVVKALSQVETEKDNFEKINTDLSRRETKATVTLGITNPVITLILNIALAIIIMIGAYRVNEGLSEAGKIIAFMSYFTIITNAVTMINRIFTNYTKGSASAVRIREILSSTSDIKVIPHDHVDTDDYITFSNVSFTYSGLSEGAKTLDGINFSLKRGETLGIIGAIGSGKTTVIQLLLRFYDISEGEIRIDGDDIRSIPLKDLRSKIGIVFQNDFLMSATIAENISLCRHLNNENIMKAAKIAHAEEFISQKENGFEYRLESKAANLSGGQKQRILLSRAFAANPELLILDDSSSALDYKTDAMLRKEINSNFKNTTKIVIAQRISSIRHADKILVLENGKMAGYGDHDTLLKSSALYYEIAKTQGEVQ